MEFAFNNDWLFTETFDGGFDNACAVRLPHTAREIPYNYPDCRTYQMVCGYKKTFYAESSWKGGRILLSFDGAAHDASVFCNGHLSARHSCGYTAFTADITEHIKFGAENEITVRLDTRESLNIPPFGFVVDYLCYGGLYREVTLQIRPEVYIKDVLIENTSLRGIHVTVNISSPVSAGRLRTDFLDRDGRLLTSAEGRDFDCSFPDAKPWTPDSPMLITARTVLLSDSGEVTDIKETRLGLRTAVFENDGFRLNGKKLKLRGLNRHQSYPYMGYAMPESIQRYDAEILKNELGVNYVRTSHYPQSQHFLDACDELGLLVFTEIPGWQHIGDEDWQKQAVENTREMVMQYMHHPSVVLWGVRINESPDCDSLYSRTNAVAHELDGNRQTSGVRCIEKSRLLEDVYAFNDFSHTGNNAGLKKKASVTSKKSKPYIVSECNGHMFPSKTFDNEQHRLDHALRHARVLDAMYADDEICGISPWCMFDYNTHKDFGSGDGICYHGVMDMFRNPKLASAVYASQSDRSPCCEVSSSMDIGEHPAGNIGKVYVFTNADSVKLYKNGVFVREFFPCRDEFPALPHPPVVIDDFIGGMLLTEEKYDRRTAAGVKYLLDALARLGPSGLRPLHYARFAKLMLLKGFKISDAYRLYGKYVSNWGGEATFWRFDAVKCGAVVKSVLKKPCERAALEVQVSSRLLREGSTYDAAAVRIRAADENGNLLPYYQEPIILKTEGEIELIGPDIIPLRGGYGGTYVRTTGKPGMGRLYINDLFIDFKCE
ncbi:MAG: glycoside hydrolase family 2 protein [Oscillospiraceae bacterium]|nr:glycoside hydrolase family 2 protein [Oscillospiraceae bacterium]